jgi:hypothetical protein
VFAVRAERLPASFVPLTVLSLLPIASAVVGVRGLRSSSSSGRRWRLILIAVAGVELVCTILAQAIVGFAIALRSG